MARQLTFKMDSNEFNSPIEKLDRAKLYGWTEKKYVDREGRECHVGSISADGLHIFGRSAFEQGYTDASGEWLERSQLSAVDIDGNLVEKKEASFGTPIALDKKVSVDDYLEYVAKSVYQLDCPELLDIVKAEDGVFTFEFNYVASYQPDTAFLVENEDVLFMVVGQKTEFDFVSLQQVDSPVLEDDEDEEDEIDFSMF